MYSIEKKTPVRQPVQVLSVTQCNSVLCCVISDLLGSETSWAVAGLVMTSLGQAVSLAWPQVTIGPLHSEKC